MCLILVFVTGDTHACFNKFSTKRFPEQRQLTREDFVIVCGDFGKTIEPAIFIL